MDEVSMLKQLSIRNFALIDNVMVEFQEGFNVLTGETGAGKSILLDSIGILCGNRASGDFIRKGESKAEVEGTFLLAGEVLERFLALDLGEPEEGLLYLSREISRTGSNKCRLNGRSIPLAAYQQVGRLLFDIHGQNQEQSLLSRDRQLDLLDRYIVLKHQSGRILAEVREQAVALKSVRQKLQQIRSARSEHLEMLDYYRFALNEIENAGITAGEEASLKEERRRIQNSEKLFKKGEQVYSLLSGNGILGNLDTVIYNLKEMQELDPVQEKSISLLENAYYEMEAFREDFKGYYQHLEYDEGRLNEIEGRLGELNRLKRKYGGSEEEILRRYGEMSEKLSASEDSEVRIAALEQEEAKLLEQYQEKASLLSARRKEGARSIEAAIRERLQALNIYPDGFSIEFLPEEAGQEKGLETVDFLFSPNPGEGVMPLRKIASGGEVSRVMLAFKGIFAELDFIPTLLFDEIDAGIGGETLTMVARALEGISRYRQVICVTHSAILAAFADLILSVRKESAEGRTTVRITPLMEEEGVIEELSRMLGGKGDFSLAEEQSREMLAFALREKKV